LFYWQNIFNFSFAIKSVFQDLVYNINMTEITMLGYK